MSESFWDEPGREATWIVCTCFYLLLVFGAIFVAVWYDYDLSQKRPMTRCAIVLAGIVIALLPTAYWWHESYLFERWIEASKKSHQTNEEEQKVKDHIDAERKLFEANQEHARAIWATIVAAFSVFLLKAK